MLKSSVFSPLKRLYQPRGLVRINRARPLSAGLVLAEFGSFDYDSAGNSKPVRVGNTFAARSFGRAFVLDGSTNYVYHDTSVGGVDLFADSSRKWSVVFYAKKNSTAYYANYVSKAGPTAGSRTFQTYGNPDNVTLGINLRGSDNTYTLSDGSYHQVTVTWDGTSAKAYVDETSSYSPSVGSASIESSEKILFGARTSSSPIYFLQGELAYVLIYNRAITQAEHLAIKANPRAVLDDDIAAVWISGASSSVALSGNAAATASASGALSVAVPVSGAAIGVLTAFGSLSTAMPLSGVAAAVAYASGAMVLGIALSGAAISSASASGTMVLQVSIDGAAVAHASATGALSVVGGYDLAGSAVATVSATGAMTTSIPLAGDAVCVASASGDLSSSSAVPLSGTAVAAFAGQGSLTVTVSLSGSAIAQAQASGGMSIQIPLSGSAVTHLSAMGYLSGGQSGLASDPRFAVQHAALDYNVFARSRKFTVTYAH